MASDRVYNIVDCFLLRGSKHVQSIYVSREFCYGHSTYRIEIAYPSGSDEWAVILKIIVCM